MKSFFKTITPQSKLLKKYIAYYYFHQSDEKKSVESYIYYPHYKNALSIYKGSTMYYINDYSTVSKPYKGDYFYGFTKLTKHAAKAEIQGPFNKIGIVFQPLGLNNFIKANYSELVNKEINLGFNYFKDSLDPILDKIFETENNEEKVKFLDTYFLSNYSEFKEPLIKRAIDLIHNSEQKYSVESLSEKLNVNRKKLLRLFKTHQNCTVNDYIKLIQFRKAIDTYQNSNKNSLLTEIAYNTNYYDQSDFINHFKKVSGFNPKSFFKNLNYLGNQDTYWTFD